MKFDQASGLRSRREVRRPSGIATPGQPLVSVASGKGGVGKTNLVANLAVAAAGLGARVLVVDGDLGLANMDVLLGLVSHHDVGDVLEGRCSLAEALVTGPRGVQLLPAASAVSELASLPPERLAKLIHLLREAAADYDLAVVDVGAGIGPSALGLASACARALVVTTPEPTSLADAYATVKVLRRRAAAPPVELVVNGASSELEALSTHGRVDRLCRRFLKGPIRLRGYLPRDERLGEAVLRQRAVVELYPSSPASQKIAEIAQGLMRDHAGPRRRSAGPASAEKASSTLSETSDASLQGDSPCIPS